MNEDCINSNIDVSLMDGSLRGYECELVRSVGPEGFLILSDHLYWFITEKNMMQEIKVCPGDGYIFFPMLLTDIWIWFHVQYNEKITDKDT